MTACQNTIDKIVRSAVSDAPIRVSAEATAHASGCVLRLRRHARRRHVCAHVTPTLT